MAKKPSIKLEKFEGSIEVFIELIGVGENNAVFMKKNRGSTLKKIWWENKEKWFCNWGDCKTTDINTSKVPWVIAKDLENHISYQMSMNELNLYTKKLN